MSGVGGAVDWQHQSVTGLAGLTPARMPALELVFLDALVAGLLGDDAPTPPYTIEHGSAMVSHLLRSCVVSSGLDLDVDVDVGPGGDQAREAVVAGAQAFAQRGGPGVQQLVTRYLAAAVGELEIHAASAEEQVRSLFYYGLLAIASGPGNQLSQASADGIMDLFAAWNDHIGEGFVPPWRVAAE